jgi:hypothetical protein
MKICRGKPDPIPTRYSPKIASLVVQCLQKTASKRPTINDILALDFVEARAAHLLDAATRKAEFSHTIFHGVAALETPDVLPPGPGTSRGKAKATGRGTTRAVTPSQKGRSAPVRGPPRAPSKEELEEQRRAEAAGEREQRRLWKLNKQREERKKAAEDEQKRLRAESQRERLDPRAYMRQLQQENANQKRRLEAVEPRFKKPVGGAGDGEEAGETPRSRPGTARTSGVAAMIAQKRAEMKAGGGGDVIEIGSGGLVIDLSEGDTKKARKPSPKRTAGNIKTAQSKPPPPEPEPEAPGDFDLEDGDGDGDFDIPDEGEAEAGSDEDEGDVYYFNGQELGLDDDDPRDRLQTALQFAKDILGNAKFGKIYDFWRDKAVYDLTEEQIDQYFHGFLQSHDELACAQLIRQCCVQEAKYLSEDLE